MTQLVEVVLFLLYSDVADKCRRFLKMSKLVIDHVQLFCELTCFVICLWGVVVGMKRGDECRLGVVGVKVGISDSVKKSM